MAQNIFTDGSGNPIGGAPDPKWIPQEIIYYKLGLKLDGNGLQFYYHMRDSGVQSLPSHKSDIRAFLQSVLDGTPAITGPLPHPERETPPDIKIDKPCYVVIHLDESWNWYFMPDTAALKTHDSLTDLYKDLTHVDLDELIISPIKAPVSGRCRLMYFAAIAPRRYDDLKPNDRFNLYIQLDQSPSQALPIIVDPDIKNDGGNPGLFGPPG